MPGTRLSDPGETAYDDCTVWKGKERTPYKSLKMAKAGKGLGKNILLWHIASTLTYFYNIVTKMGLFWSN